MANQKAVKAEAARHATPEKMQVARISLDLKRVETSQIADARKTIPGAAIMNSNSVMSVAPIACDNPLSHGLIRNAIACAIAREKKRGRVVKPGSMARPGSRPAGQALQRTKSGSPVQDRLDSDIYGHPRDMSDMSRARAHVSK